jgi:hypothetical protein
VTFHGVRKAHVELNGILAGREGDYVAMRVSKRAKKTISFAEYVEKGVEKGSYSYTCRSTHLRVGV